MAGNSHNYSMNINIKAQADVGKTNNELTQLANEVKELDGKKIDIKVQLGGNASKSVDSLVQSIGNIEKSLNSLSTKGIQTVEQGFSSLNKTMTDVVSAIGSVQKSLDGINGKGLQSVQQDAGSATKSLEDVASSAGHTQTALDGINGKGLESIIDMASKAEDAMTDLASQMESLNTTSGFGDNWNNSYGGRYGGMRYTGQGKGIDDLVSFLGNGKSAYELTIENAMNKTRNMAVAKSWQQEDGISGMDAYWALDSATNHSLMSLNTLAAGINATAATTGASAKDIKNHARDFADFGTMVLGLGYDESVAQTAVMKLGRGLHGTFAALDQYGITKESLTNTGLWSGDENDLDGFMAAVSKYSRTMSENLLSTTTGQMATMSKSASLGGYALGEMEAQAMRDVVGGFKYFDDALRGWTKSLNIPWLSGADVSDNLGQKVLSRIPRNPDGTPKEYIDYNNNGTYEEKEDEAIEESLYVSNQPGTAGKIVDDYGNVVYNSIAEAYAAGFNQKRTGIGLSTMIIGAEQAISTYKVLKDTILGTYAELRDFRRIRQIGLKNIFKGDDYMIGEGGHIVKEAKGINTDACNAINADCPANGSSGSSGSKGKGKSKKKSRLGKWKDSIGNKMDNLKNTITGTNPNMGKTKQTAEQRNRATLNKKFGSKFTNETGDYNLNVASAGFGLLNEPIDEAKNIGMIEDTVPKMKGAGNTVAPFRHHSTSADVITKGETESGRTKTRRQKEINRQKRAYRRATMNDYSGKVKPTMDIPSLNTGTAPEREGSIKYPKGTKTTNKQSSLQKSNLQNKFSNDFANIGRSNKKLSKMSSLKNYFSKANEEREAHGNRYGGYLKRTNKAIYDTKQLKSKARGYIKNKKKLIKDEWARGVFKGNTLKDSWSSLASGGVKTMGASLPQLASGFKWSNIKSMSQGTLVGNLGSNIASKFSSAKSAVTGTRAWQGFSGFMSGVGRQVKGNANAMYGMATGGKKIGESRIGKKWNTMKQSGGVTGAVSRGASRFAGGVSKVGGAALSGASSVAGGIAGGIGKIGGLLGGITSGIGALLGPIGMILMAVTLITGLLDAMGVDWMGPLQKAFGGFMKALQPAIQGFGTWLEDTATRLEPVLTQIGQVLGPILQGLGSMLSGGLEGLVNVLTPVFEGLSSIFGGSEVSEFGNTLTRAGNILSQLGKMGGEGLVGLFGGVFDGLGEYIRHVFQQYASAVSQFWNTISTGFTNAITGVINGIVNAISGGITMIGTAFITILSAFISTIVGGFALIGGQIVTVFAQFATGVVLSTITAYAALAQFQGQAVSIMRDTAVQMTDNFKNNLKIKSTVETEMSGAYDALSYWGDLMVAKVGEIASRMTAIFPSNMNVGSPGTIWTTVANEMRGATQSLISYGAKMVSSAGMIGQNMANSFVKSQLDVITPTANYPEPVDIAPPISPVSPPKVTEPKVSKELKKQRTEDVNRAVTYNFNHYGDIDNEERMQKTLKYFSNKIDFENKRANRTV